MAGISQKKWEERSGLGDWIGLYHTWKNSILAYLAMLLNIPKCILNEALWCTIWYKQKSLSQQG
jgi:hypothetical protein